VSALAPKQLAQVGGQGPRFGVELGRGDAGDAIAGSAQAPVAGAIVAEGGAGAMSLPAVKLDDLAGGGPEAVDSVALPVDFQP
jgi:hypothetical protein